MAQPLSDQTLGELFGANASEFLTKVDKLEVADDVKLVLITNYARDTIGLGLRTFAFARPVAAADPDCKSDFVTSFEHQEWRDGEDLVQADGIDGFNIRFNRLRADLKSIEQELRDLVGCVASLRQQVSSALGEVAAEINVINRKVHDCCDSREPDVGGGPYVVPTPTYPGYEYPYPYPYPPVGPGPGDPFPGAGGLPRNFLVSDLLRRYGRGAGPITVGTAPEPPREMVWRAGPESNEGILAGMRVTRVDVTTIGGKSFEVWDSPLGGILVPLASGAEVKVAPVAIAPEMQEYQAFETYMAAHPDDVAALVRGRDGVTKQAFVDRFGGVAVGDGRTVADLMKDIPGDTRFTSAGAISAAVAGAVAGAIERKGTDDIAIAGTIGLTVGGVAPAEAGIEAAKFVPEDVRRVLADTMGVETVGKLAEIDPGKLQSTLADKGIVASAADVRGWVSTGRVVSQLGVGP